MKIIKLLSLTSLILLAACGGNKENENQDIVSDSSNVTVKDTTPITVSDTTKFKFDFAIANIPSPANSMNQIKDFQHHYDNGLLNDVKNLSKYNTEFQKSLNLGIYNIDMAYAMVNDKGEDVLKYMKNVMMLSDKLGLKSAVDVMVGKRAENNLSNRDSLFKILDEIFVKSDSYLRTNERVYTAATIFAGSWLESLYIICRTAENPLDNSAEIKIHTHLWEQRLYLGNLIILLNDFKDQKECAELIAELKPIHEAINSIPQAKLLDDAKFDAISNSIKTLRNKHTSNN
ncbi:MAG: hypothetical protein LCH32_03450 [Bacteroidetes bacterium]|nr:hypothetical protein [Bacteroidota bacterium]